MKVIDKQLLFISSDERDGGSISDFTVAMPSHLEAAKIGVMRRAGQDDIVVYDYAQCIAILQQREGWTDEEAEEWMETNEMSAWVGDGTPGFVVTQDRC